MRDATNNPFASTDERVPRVWAGRHTELADWRDRLRPRRLGGQREPGRALLGGPGIGKSVLLRRIAALATSAGDLVADTVTVQRGGDPLPVLGQALVRVAEEHVSGARDPGLQAAVERVRRLVGSGASAAAGEGFQRYRAIEDLLVALGRTALRAGQVLLVAIDDLHAIGDDAVLTQLLLALGGVLDHDEPVTAPSGQRLVVALPVVVYLAGLPEVRLRASSEAGATFARHVQSTLLGPLEDADVRAALRPFAYVGWPVSTPSGRQRVAMTPAAIDEIVATCQGDPYLFQLAGQHAWQTGEEQSVDVDDVRAGWRHAASDAAGHVERLLRGLPDLERSFLAAMAELPAAERTATAIARSLGYDRASQLGPTAQRLDTVRGIVARGKPYTFRLRAVEAYLAGDLP